MTYDSWKTRSPDDELFHGLPYDDGEPEVAEGCPECCGEGAIEVWESVSRWSIDPPCGLAVPCTACGGSGVIICEPVRGLELYELEERCGDV